MWYILLGPNIIGLVVLKFKFFPKPYLLSFLLSFLAPKWFSKSGTPFQFQLHSWQILESQYVDTTLSNNWHTKTPSPLFYGWLMVQPTPLHVLCMSIPRAILVQLTTKECIDGPHMRIVELLIWEMTKIVP